MMYNCKTIGDGVYEFNVYGRLYEVLASYTITDHSTEQGTMYLVQRADDTTKSVWTEDFIQAQDICKADYNARR